MSKLFIAISTGQMVALLPTFIEFAKTEDSIYLLETDQAKKSTWSNGAIQVLKGRNIPNITKIDIGSTIKDLSQSLKTNLKTHNSFSEVFVVGNGGTKLQLLNLWQELHCLGMKPKMLYGEANPCGYIYESDLTQCESVHYYTGASITLAEVLAASGHQFSKGDKHKKIWPETTRPIHESLYGIDPDYTAKLHDAHKKVEDHKRVSESKSLPKFNEVVSILSDLDNELEKYYNSIIEGSKKLVTSYDEKTKRYYICSNNKSLAEIKENKSVLSSLFNTVIKASQKAINTANSKEIARPSESLGQALENAAANRVYDWLNNNPKLAEIVSEAHSGVKVSHQKNLDQVIAEFDVVLVLKNGVLINLECKSHDVNRKDMDARNNNLQKSASNLARTYVVFPIYSQFSDRDWFMYIHNLKDNFQHIAFTLPGQPSEYQTTEKDGVKTHKVLNFEESLNKVLKSYL